MLLPRTSPEPGAEATPFDRFLGRSPGAGQLDRLDRLILLLGYGLLVVMFFGPYAFADQLLSAPGSDLFTEWLWKRTYLGEALRAGRLPVMNPFIMANVPFLASNQSAIFYPLNWLFALVPAVLLINAQIMVHFWAGLAAMHLLARRLGRSREGAVIAALVFGFSGFAVLHWWQGHLPFVLEWPWTPLAVLGWASLQDRAQATPGAGTGTRNLLAPALGLSFVLAMQFFAGHPQITWFTLLILAILQAGWTTAAFLQRRRPGSMMASPLRGTVWMGAALLLTALLVAVQALPTLAFSATSFRGSKIPLYGLTMFSLPPSQAVLLAAPWAFGGTAQIPYLDSPVSMRSIHEVGCYLGATTVVLVLGGALGAAGRRDGKGLRWTLAAMGLFGFWMALGEHAKLYELMLKVLPGLTLFRCPGRFCYVFSFAAGLLAAQGLDTLHGASGEGEQRRTVRRTALILLGTLGAGALLFLLLFRHGAASAAWRAMLSDQTFRTPTRVLPEAIYTTYFDQYRSSLAGAALVMGMAIALIGLMLQRRIRPFVPGLLVVLLAAELVHFALRYQTSSSVGSVTWPAAIRRHLQAAGPRWRMGSARSPADLCQGMAAGVRHVWGADPLMAQQYTSALLISQKMDKGRYASQLMPQLYANSFTRALGMRWLLLPADTRPADAAWHPVGQAGPCLLVEDRDALPRGYTVASARTVPTERELPRAVNAADFQPSQTVLLLDPVPAGAPGEETAASATLPAPGQVTILRDEPEHFEAQVDMSRPGWFVLMDQLLAGWSARVDGAPARLYLANAAGRALPLKAGTHRVEMTYQASGLRTGAWISALGWLVWLAGCGSLLLSRTRHRPSPAPVAEDGNLLPAER